MHNQDTNNNNSDKNNEYNIDLDSVLKESDIEAIDLYDEESKNPSILELKEQSETSQAKNSKEFIPIQKTMMIEEIVTTYPEVVPILMDYGVHCVGCGGASFETLEEGLMGHGAGSDDVDGVIYELNEFLKNKFENKE
jgi:hybrid cluster-associated redox disulfide protein